MPQQRGELTEEQRRRIATAMSGLEKAKRARDQAITAALKAGASIRVVAEFTGMSTSTLQGIGHSNGWPTAEQKRQWAIQREQNEMWRAWTRGEPPEPGSYPPRD